MRGQVILLVGVGHQRIVGGHHGHIQVDKVFEERRLIVLGFAGWYCPAVSIAVTVRGRGLLTSVVDVRLDIPVGVHISGVVLLHARGLNLFETPLGEVDISRTQVTAESDVPQPERRGEGPNPRAIGGGGIADDFDLPVILLVPHGDVAVA